VLELVLGRVEALFGMTMIFTGMRGIAVRFGEIVNTVLELPSSAHGS
jgi:hypothetical protein